MDEFTSRIEELNSNLTIQRVSTSSHNLAVQAEAYNGSASTSYFVSGLGNGSLTGTTMLNSASSSQLLKETPFMEEVHMTSLISVLAFPFIMLSLSLFHSYKYDLPILARRASNTNHSFPPDCQEKFFLIQWLIWFLKFHINTKVKITACLEVQIEMFYFLRRFSWLGDVETEELIIMVIIKLMLGLDFDFTFSW